MGVGEHEGTEAVGPDSTAGCSWGTCMEPAPGAAAGQNCLAEVSSAAHAGVQGAPSLLSAHCKPQTGNSLSS